LGTVFELAREAKGSWTEKVLRSFSDNGKDGFGPYGGLIFDASGNLYGTTYYGGNTPDCNSNTGCGTVFELTPDTSGRWKEKILHNFNGTDGAGPYARLIFDASGNLYGTTVAGGIYDGGVGTVFELTRKAGGSWAEKVLHEFNYNGTDGIWPFDSVIFDASGNLYGTTSAGGFYEVGTVFELTPEKSKGWTEKILYSFDDATASFSPYAGLIFDTVGNLYGTTVDGGGTVFEITP